MWLIGASLNLVIGYGQQCFLNASANIVFLEPDWRYVLTQQDNEMDDSNLW